MKEKKREKKKERGKSEREREREREKDREGEVGKDMEFVCVYMKERDKKIGCVFV